MGQEITDLGSRVATAILGNPRISQAVIEVENKNGSILLRGSTATEEDRIRAGETASNQSGVKEVINDIKSLNLL